MIRCAICDDNQQIIAHIEKLTSTFFTENHAPSQIKIYSDARQFVFDICENAFFDIAILDIEMPHYSGMELAKKLKEKQPECLIVFLTSHIEYAIDAFELDVFRYIPKTELESRLSKCISDAVKQINIQDTQSYIIIKNGILEKIPYKFIRYIRKSGKYTSLYCINNQETKVRKPISDVKNELNSREFITIDRGCIVNITQISKLAESDIYLNNGERLPVSRSNIKEIRRIIADYWGGKI